MKRRHKLAAAVTAAAIGLVGVFAIGASAGSSGENQAPTVYVQFAVIPSHGGFLARAVIAQAPAPPPATGTPYGRVFQAKARTRAVAIDRLIGKMTDELAPAKVIRSLGLAIAEEDLG